MPQPVQGSSPEGPNRSEQTLREIIEHPTFAGPIWDRTPKTTLMRLFTMVTRSPCTRAGCTGQGTVG